MIKYISAGRASGKWYQTLSKLVEQWKKGKTTMMIGSEFVYFSEYNR